MPSRDSAGMRVPFLVLTLAFIHSFAAAGASGARSSLPFHLTPRGGIVVSVFLDGMGPVPFLIDTGSNGSAISQSLASTLRTPIVAKTTVSSAFGQRPRAVARIEQFAMDGVTAAPVLATVIPDEDLALPDGPGGRRGVGVQGIVGQDVLAGLRYTIDYRERRIIWRDAARGIPRNASVLALEPSEDRFLVVLPQDRATIKLVPDSGADALVLFREAGDGRPRVTVSGLSATVSGVAGQGAGMMARVDRLHVGSQTLRDVPAVILEGAQTARSSDGLLPLHLFARVTFNGPERQLIIER